tara:strand:+ start:3985 stop:4548 length:564 start_codon:yes stop_codon:yes gene_type:complete
MNPLTRESLQLNKGPSGRVIAQPMDKGLIEAFYEHLTIERSASAEYFAMSLWFAERELRGFSKFYEKESKEEQEHASNFAKYLIARGQTVLLEALSAPVQEYESVKEIVEHTFQIEADVTSSLQQLYSMADTFNDTRSNVFLDPVIENQISSEDDFAYLLGKVNLANEQTSAIFIIDSELYQGNLNK